MKISFDIDGTLDNDQILQFAYLMKSYIYIISYRESIKGLSFGRRNLIETMWYFIPNKVFLLGGTERTKLEVIIEEGINIHFDDDEHEVQKINNYARENGSNFTAVLVNHHGIALNGLYNG